MNDLLTRDYHEVVGNILKIEMNEDFRLGNALIDRIPFNYIGEQEENFKEVSDYNPLAMTEEELRALIPKLNFNLPDTKLRLVEKGFIEKKNYWELYELYKGEYPFNLMNDMSLYSYCRSIVGMPMTNDEFVKIRKDMKSIKKNMKHINSKQIKKKKGVYSIDF